MSVRTPPGAYPQDGCSRAIKVRVHASWVQGPPAVQQFDGIMKGIGVTSKDIVCTVSRNPPVAHRLCCGQVFIANRRKLCLPRGTQDRCHLCGHTWGFG
eukprot:1443135-Amphidinium_carterae.1